MLPNAIGPNNMLRFALARTTLRSRPWPLVLPYPARGVSSCPLLMTDWSHDQGRVGRNHGGRFGGHHDRGFFSVLPMIILPFVPIVCLGLGVWQLQRLQWKVNLIEDLQDKLQRAPMNLPRNVKCVRRVSSYSFMFCQLLLSQHHRSA